MAEDTYVADPNDPNAGYAQNAVAAETPSDSSSLDASGITTSAVSGAAMGSSLGPWGAAAGAVLGAGLSIFGQLSAASAKQNAEQQQAAIEQAKAMELMRRQAINDQISAEQGSRQASTIGAEQSTSAEQSGIGMQLASLYATQRSIQNADTATTWQANMTQLGATQDVIAGNAAMTAGYIGSASTVLTGAGQTYNAFQPPSSNGPATIGSH